MTKNRYLRMSAVLMLLIATIFIITGCGQDSGKIDYSKNPINMETNEDAIENFTVATDTEVKSLNPAHISFIQEQELITNIYDTLTAIDRNGEVIPSVALSWEHSDDYKTWTFRLRDDCYWVNYKGEIVGTVKAQDFVTGFEFVTNFAKSEGKSSFISNDVIVGANDYAEYTAAIPEEEAKKLTYKEFSAMVGFSAPDDVTVVVETVEPCSFLPSFMACSVFVPASQEHIDDIGIDNYIINAYQTAWYNGPYILTEFIKSNVKIIDANPHWYGNKEHTRFKSVTYKLVQDASMAYQLYQNNEVDEVTLSQSQLKRILDDKDGKYYGKTVTRKSESLAGYLSFNYDKADDENWNKAVANTAFRRTFVYGLDNYSLCQYLNRANPAAIDVKTVQPYGGGTMSDGTQYKDIVLSMLNYAETEDNSFVKNKKLFEKYKKQAIKELTALGVTFPVDLDYYANEASESSINFARIMKNLIESSLGTDFIEVNIKTYASSYFVEVANKRLESISERGYAYDYRDPSNILGLFDNGAEGSSYEQYTNCTRLLEEEKQNGVKGYRKELLKLIHEYDRMYDAANRINDNDERLMAFAKLEAFLIDNGLFVVPFYNDRIELLTNIDEESFSLSSISGYDNRYVDVKTHKQK